MNDMNHLKTTNEPTSKKKSNKFLVILLVFIGACILACIVFIIYQVINRPIVEANALAARGQCNEAVAKLNIYIEKHPDSTRAYEIRFTCYLNSTSNVFTEAQGYLLLALQDANTMIALKPKDFSYYASRNLTLRELANFEQYAINKFEIYDLANQDTNKSIALNAPEASYVYRHYARNLIEGNHCQEGLEETQKLIQKYGTQNADYGQYYSLYLTEAYICLGELDLALESAQSITCDDPVSTCKSGLLTEIYLQSGDYENALNTVNYMINWQPVGGGWRYFIRALIYYEQGQIDFVQQDLATGDAYSWYGTGVDEYVLAQLAFDNGDKASGIYHLQTAEQMFDINYSVLRQKTLEQLKKYGAEPIPQTIDLPFNIPSLP